MKISGIFEGPEKSCYLYLIYTNNLLYIGETQRIAFVRWQEHLTREGSFRKAIYKYGDPEVDYFQKLIFLAINCEEIRNSFGELNWKSVTQAVEHEIHCKLSVSPSLVETDFEIISNTDRTAPVSLGSNVWDFAKEYAKEIVKPLVTELNAKFTA